MADVRQFLTTHAAFSQFARSDHPAVLARSGSSLARAALPGMVARGHGIEALCSYLQMARTALFELTVELDLAIPHDRPLRKAGGRNPWSVPDTILFIVLWLAGWHAESLGQRFGRSAASAWAKARQLGLPRRDRKSIFRPAHPYEVLPADVPQGHHAPPEPTLKADGDHLHVRVLEPEPTSDQLPQTDPLLARDTSTSDIATTLHYPAQGPDDLFGPTPVGTPPRQNAKQQNIPWPRERDKELARRWWARQHYKAIARDMGISPSAVQSRRARLGLPTFNDSDLGIFHRYDLVDEFDESVVEENIALARYVERKCSKFAEIGKEFWFWCLNTKNTKQFISPAWKQLQERQRKRLSTARPKYSPPTLQYASHAL